jgi:hypothetical protein
VCTVSGFRHRRRRTFANYFVVCQCVSHAVSKWTCSSQHLASVSCRATSNYRTGRGLLCPPISNSHCFGNLKKKSSGTRVLGAACLTTKSKPTGHNSPMLIISEGLWYLTRSGEGHTPLNPHLPGRHSPVCRSCYWSCRTERARLKFGALL